MKRVEDRMKERGAVSIFIVIFTALLVTVVTTSFVQVTLRNQQQATDNDLAQSAYDSAMSGVEDAKRALVRLKKCQLNPTDTCGAFINAMNDARTNCEVLGKPQIGIANFQGAKHEVRVGDISQNQAYTCVTVAVNTTSYKGELTSPQSSVVIPLVPVPKPDGTSNANNIKKVRISWFTRDDVAVGITAPSIPTTDNLPAYGEWPTTAPPIIRAQLIQFNKGSIELNKFDEGNARTRLLYPKSGSGRPSADLFARDTRGETENRPSYGGCEANFSYGEDNYACSVEIELPDMPAGQTREAYLQLAGYYIQALGTHYMVEMISSEGVDARIDFDNVQPEVDSTGRAADLFRRVKARINISESGVPDQYPEAALSTRNICKEFFITGDANDYDANGNGVSPACSPEI